MIPPRLWCWMLMMALLSLAYPPHARTQKTGMLTGSQTGTYFRFGQEIAAVTITHGLEVLVKESEGSIANIRRLMSTENAALAMVQSDVLGFLNWSADPVIQGIAARLRLIFPFYNEEVHLLARKEIQHIADLTGKRVIVGTEGSGAWLTAYNLLHMLDIQPAVIRHDLLPPEAVRAVLTAEADAMFYVSGKPVTLFTNMQDLLQDSRYVNLLSEVHFVPLQDEKMLQEYSASSIGPHDYAWVHTTVPTVAVRAVLIGFDFTRNDTSYFRMRCAQLATLGRAVRDNFAALQATGHPKWQEVDLAQRVSLWRLDTCSQSVRRDLTRYAPLQQDFEAIVQGKGGR